MKHYNCTFCGVDRKYRDHLAECPTVYKTRDFTPMNKRKRYPPIDWGMITTRIMIGFVLGFVAAVVVEAQTQRPMDFVCDTLGIECTDVPNATIVFGELPDTWRGAYFPKDKLIVISEDLEVDLIMEIIIHEMTHHVIRQVHGAADRCWDEKMARLVVAVYIQVKYTDDWKGWYDCNGTQEPE